MAANEASAVGSVRTMNTAAISYNSTYGNGFPPSIGAIGNNGTTSISCTNAELIDTVLTAAPRAATRFRCSRAPSTLNSSSSSCVTDLGYSDGYMVTAVPVSVGTTGQRSFCTDASGVIRFNTQGQSTVVLRRTARTPTAPCSKFFNDREGEGPAFPFFFSLVA